jgi:DNA (cytosine-5)-methyltransferase 1
MLVLEVIDTYGKNARIHLQVTAVEYDPELARLYQERFPNDKVIVADAHQYLLDHYQEFDFIWSSPPCPTHSRLVNTNKNRKGYKNKYPDMKLYQEIIFLKHIYQGNYIVENVIPYYDPLIPAQKRGRHLYWSNFVLPNNLNERKDIKGMIGFKTDIKAMSKFHCYDFTKYKGDQPVKKIAANLVDYEAGKTIFETLLGVTSKKNLEQKTLF